MKQDRQNDMKLLSVSVDQMQVFARINKGGIMINADVYVKIDKGISDQGFIRNPSNCECDQSCDAGEYLDYLNLSVEKGQLIN